METKNENKLCKNGHERIPENLQGTNCKICAKERNKQWCLKNSEKKKEQAKQRDLDNPEKRRERNKKWDLNNPEKRKKASKEWNLRNPEKYKETKKRCAIKRKYNLTLEQYEELKTKQNNVCVICNKSFQGITPHVDHCHTTNKIRGLLCTQCNVGLGSFKDNIESLQNAIKYLTPSGND